jgi:drug/metabolite transporter (DMT)-like permease
MTPALRGILLICFATMCFIGLDSMNKLMTRELPPLQVVWGRTAAQFLLMSIILLPRMGMRLVRTRRPWIQVARGICLGLSSVFAVFALSRMPLADAVAIANLQPLLIVMLSALILHERPSAARWLAVVIGFVGVLVVVRPGSGATSLLGALGMFSASITMSFYFILTRKLGTTEIPVTSLYLVSAVGTVMFSVTTPAVWVPLPTPWYWAGFVVAGCLGGFGHWLMTRAIALAPASTLAPFTYTTLIWATAASWIGFGDVPNWGTLVGITIIGGAGIYSALLERRDSRRT